MLVVSTMGPAINTHQDTDVSRLRQPVLQNFFGNQKEGSERPLPLGCQMDTIFIL